MTLTCTHGAHACLSAHMRGHEAQGCARAHTPIEGVRTCACAPLEVDRPGVNRPGVNRRALVRHRVGEGEGRDPRAATLETVVTGLSDHSELREGFEP